MEKDVLLTISGLQELGGDSEDEPIEVVTSASYFYKNGKHYVLYDEVQEGESSVSRNTIQFTDRYISVTKHGAENVHMVIESEKQNVTYYHTPVGMMHISLDGKNVTVSEKKDSIKVEARYGLDINYEHIANCTLQIGISPRNDGIKLNAGL